MVVTVERGGSADVRWSPLRVDGGMVVVRVNACETWLAQAQRRGSRRLVVSCEQWTDPTRLPGLHDVVVVEVGPSVGQAVVRPCQGQRQGGLILEPQDLGEASFTGARHHAETLPCPRSGALWPSSPVLASRRCS